MATRRSIEIDQLTHLTAIPVATQIGPLLVSSVVSAYNPHTRDLPETAAEQLANIFSHVGAALEAAGATWDDVAKMDFWAPSAEMRSEIDTPWVEHFPDPASRPSRHTHQGTGDAISASFIAYTGP